MDLFDNRFSFLSSDIDVRKVNIVVREDVSGEGLDHTIKLVDINSDQSILVFELINNDGIIKKCFRNVWVELVLTFLSFFTYFLQNPFFSSFREQLSRLIGILMLRRNDEARVRTVLIHKIRFVFFKRFFEIFWIFL